MNRPFSAFATLMTLLALAMFAVSSTSRSTTVQPGKRVRGSGFRVQQNALEVSDLKSEVGGPRSEVRSKQIAMNRRVLKTREKSLMAAATGGALKPLAVGNGEQSVMRAALVVVAENSVVRSCDAPRIDCRSHYDPTYDLVVYGVRDFGGRLPVATESEATSANLPDELDGIFRELASRQAKGPLPQAGAMKVHGVGIRWKSLAAAIGAWLNYQVCGGPDGRSSAGIGWAEYAEFAGHIGPQSVASVEAAETSDSE